MTEEEEHEIPELTGNIINIIGNSFSAVIHAGDPRLKDDIRFARQKAVKALVPEIKDSGYWCVHKHICATIVNLHEQAYKAERKGEPTEGIEETIGLYRKLAEITWAAMLTGDLDWAREHVKGE